MTTEPYPLHEGDMAAELAEREYYNVPPLELLNIASEEQGTQLRFDEALKVARAAIDRKWADKATQEPEEVRRIYESTIGFDGFPGSEVDQ